MCEMFGARPALLAHNYRSASADHRHEWRYTKCSITLHYITLHYITLHYIIIISLYSRFI